MIYFDSTYLGRLYLQEPGSAAVRSLAAAHGAVTCCALGQAEVASIFHRKLREGAITPDEHAEGAAQLDDDIAQSIIAWLPATPALIAQVRKTFATLPPTVFLRAADALHLVCAREAELQEIYTNDRHMLAAAPHFGLKGVNVIPAS